MDKGPEAFRTISEVADDLDLPQHVLRFWETRFSHIKPLKRGGGRRYYRPDDIVLLRGIKHLLYGEGYTIKGVQRILREQGPRHVMAIWQEADIDDDEAMPPPSPPEMYAPHRASVAQENTEQDFAPTFSPRHNVPQPDDAPEPVIDRNQREEPQLSAPVSVSKSPSLSREDVRRLQKTLFDLLECKEILDSAR